MTEAEWLASADPPRMVEHLRECLRPRWVLRFLQPSRERPAHRKLRLFAGYVLLCHYPFKCTDEDRRNIQDDLDRWADGKRTEQVGEAHNFFSLWGECFCRNFELRRTPWDEAERAAWWCLDPADPLNGSRECSFLRDLFGNPFRPGTFSPDWRTDTAVLLARQMYNTRDFSAMPILADALQDAGCEDEQILSHCRGDGSHVRGCWVCDLVLNKS